MESFFIDVIVPLSVPNKYTYRVPTFLNSEICIGKRVIVQFGKSKLYTGIIYKIHNVAPQFYEAKYIEAVIDEQPIVLQNQLQFWDWLALYYCANPGDVLNAALPSGLKLNSNSHIQINPDFNFEETPFDYFTKNEHKIFDALNVTPTIKFEDVAKILTVKSIQPIIANLIKKNAIQVYEEVKDKYKPKLITYIKIHNNFNNENALNDLLQSFNKKNYKQLETIMAYLSVVKQNKIPLNSWISKSELNAKLENNSLNSLIKKQIFVEEKIEEGRLIFEKSNKSFSELNQQQNNSLLEVIEGFKLNKPVVLNGVTGSGKTEIYIQLINNYILKGKQVLYLIPEIALTTQLITRLRAVFGEQVGVYHSKFSENERVEIWQNVLNFNTSKNKNDYKIILGARSSLFLPFSQLGLIIVDEEHDNSFKQHDPSPRYHARDAALYLANTSKANILLGSATPSVETIYQANTGKYIKVNLTNQFVKGGGTQIEICDTKYFEQTQQMRGVLTMPLYNAIVNALENKKQIILFQNRRGYAPYTECKDCAYIPQCVQCDVSLIYHKQSNKLSCHYCGYSTSPPQICNACGSSKLIHKGLGTEKIEEEIEILFPQAKIARMDLDTTRSKYSFKQIIDDFDDGKTNILVGTQMITKGLDFKNVSVVGILNADTVLSFPDFRSYEKAYQLFVQVKGRAGRNKEIGKFYIQTSQPNHEVIKHVLKNNLPEFYFDILKQREEHFYPPFSRLIEINIQSKDLNELNHLSDELTSLFKSSLNQNNVLGPEFPLVKRVKTLYIKRILLKINRNDSVLKTRELITEQINTLNSKFKAWNFRVNINIDPV